MNGFELATGSVPGTDHTKPGKPFWKNNQDASDFWVAENCLIGVVCDGCGGAGNSEFGARLGARLVLQALRHFIGVGVSLAREPDVLLELVANRVSNQLMEVAALATSSKAELEAYAARDLLFTIMGVAMDGEAAMVFSFGDGVYAVNGETTVIPPFPGNAPPYIAYLFLPHMLERTPVRFELRAHLQIADVESILIGSDGVADLIEAADAVLPKSGAPIGPLSQFWEQAIHTINPDSIRRRLAVINREYIDEQLIRGGPLTDDTTLLVVRRS